MAVSAPSGDIGHEAAPGEIRLEASRSREFAPTGPRIMAGDGNRI